MRRKGDENAEKVGRFDGGRLMTLASAAMTETQIVRKLAGALEVPVCEVMTKRGCSYGDGEND